MSPLRTSDEQLLATDLHVEATYRLTEALVESEHRMRRRVELLSEVVFETAADGRLVFLNRAWEDATGFPVDASRGRLLTEFVEPADAAALAEAIATVGDRPRGGDRPLLRVRHCDGAMLWFELSLAPLPGGGAVGVLHNITRPKIVQDELAKVSLVASYTDNMVIITGPDGLTEWVNRSFVERTGYTLADLVGKKPGHLLQGAQSDQGTIEQIRDAVHAGRAFRAELLNYTKSGQPYWVQLQINPIRDARGDIVQYVSIQSDVTDRHRGEADIRALNADLERRVLARTAQLAQFKSALDQHGLVAITDRTGKITYVNDRLCAVSGYAREELVGEHHRKLSSGIHSPAFYAELWATITRGDVWHGEIMDRARDGTAFWVDTTIVPFVDDAGVPDQYVAIQTDITEQKAAEARVSQLNRALESGAERLRDANTELESFAYSVSHDLRAPLRHIHGYLDMLRRSTDGQLSDKSSRYLQTVSDASIEMGQLIDDLLAFSRMGQAEMRLECVQLAPLVRETVDALAAAAPDRVIAWHIDEMPAVAGDLSMLRQVLVNLIANAIKYTGKRAQADIRIECRGMEHGQYVFAICDNGAGFDMAYADKLFGVFQRLHRAEDFEGTGIGLAIVRRVIVRHGGRIWAEAAPEQGATFCFTLAPAPAVDA